MKKVYISIAKIILISFFLMFFLLLAFLVFGAIVAVITKLILP